MGIKKNPLWVDYRKVKPQYFRCGSCARAITRRSIKTGGCKACGGRQVKLPCRTNLFERFWIFITRR